MSRYLILEWNEHAMTAVAACVQRGGRATVEQLFSIDPREELPAPASDKASTKIDDDEIARRIQAVVRQRGLGRAQTTVALGRNDVEIRRLSLPPCPEEELPDMVRFQAMREFNALTEAAPLDFFPLTEAADKTRAVMAATVNPGLVDRIRRIASKAELKVDHLVLKSGGTVALWRTSSLFDNTKVELLVSLTPNEAELIVLADGRIVFLRTTRLHADPLESPDNVLGFSAEIRRTMMAAHSQLGERRVERVILCGASERSTALAASLEKNLGLPTLAFDALAAIELTGEAARVPDSMIGCYVPLCGIVVEQTDAATRPLFDFFHPRKAPAPVGPRNQIAMAATAVVLLFATAFGWLWYSNQQIVAQIQELQDQQRKLAIELPKMQAQAKQTAAIESWEGRIRWIDELAWLSARLPASEAVVLDQLTLSLTSGDRVPPGRITFSGRARDPETFAPMEESLRDERHRVLVPSRTQDRTGSSRYGWRFDAVVVVDAATEPSVSTPDSEL